MEDFHSHSQSQFVSSLSPPSDLMLQTTSADVHSIPAPSDSRTSNSDGVCLSSAGSISARYKLMSPAKLPISRSTCITIPPGLSPSSFLESPILLSNVKVEPSPTTGSFLNPQFMYFSGGASGLSFPSNTSNRNPVIEREVGHFQFKLPTQSNQLTGLSPAAPLEIEASGQDQSHTQPQSFAAVPSIKAEMAPLPREPVPIFAERSAAVDSDELNQGVATNPGGQVLQSDQNDAGNLTVPDRSSDDGYNWRKYGQKLVKGCEFPRSYYKCTHPNCEVKKIFERTPDGQIKEIVYKGTHDHPKPQPTRRFGAGSIVAMPDRNDNGLSSTMREDKNTMNAQMSHATEPNGNSDLSPGGTNDDGLEGVQYNNDEYDDDDPFSKRRKMEVGNFDVTPVVKPIREPRVVVQTISEVDILDDGYRWRKYGQKVVRGNPNPRSYYKCTNAGCPVRKHVERASHDPKAVITTYEGKHNHDVPTAKNSNNNNNNNNHDNSNGGGPRTIRSEDNNAINLGLGVGIGSAGSEEQQHHNAFGVESYRRSQMENRHGNFDAIQIMPVQGGYYGGVVNNGQFAPSRQSHHVVD